MKSNRSVYKKEIDTWVNFGVVPAYELADRSKNGLVYPELYNKLKDLESKKDNLNNLRLTEEKPYFYLFHSSDKLLRFSIEGNSLRIEVNKEAIFRKLVKFPCAGKKGQKGTTGDIGISGKPPPIERIRQTNNKGEFEIDVATPLDDQPISLRGFDTRGEKQLWEVLINLDGSYNDPNSHIKDLELNNNTITATLSDPSNKFKIRQKGSKGPAGEDGKNYVVSKTTTITPGSAFIQVVESLWYNKTANQFVYKRTSLSELLNNVLSVSAQSFELPTGDFWAALEISTESLKSVEYHQFLIQDQPDLEIQTPQWTPLSGCYDQKRFTLGYLNYNTIPFDIIKDPYPNYSGCKEPFWFCGNTGDVCDGEINVDPAENNILFIESTSSLSSESSGSSISSASTSSSLSSDTSEPSPSSSSDQSRESFSSISTSSPFDESSESTVSGP